MSSLKAPSVILITGATGGIGRALARVYAGPGRTLVLHGRNAGKLDQLKLECEQSGARVVPLIVDLADSDKLMGALDAICENFAIDLLIVNAGTTNGIGPEGEDWPDIQRVIDINLRAAMATISAVVPQMRKRHQGQVALISSLSAYVGLPVTPAYCASKAALKAYGEALRGWLSPQGIAVNVVLPGFVETSMSRQFPTSKPFMLSADDAAQRIKSALVRNRARISFPMPLAFGMWLLSTLPVSWSQWILRKLGFASPKS